MSQDNYNEFFHDFLIESTEHLQTYERCLLEIENVLRRPDFSFDLIREQVQAIFRSVHTIKGLAGMMEFTHIKDYTHEAEGLLDLVRSQQVQCNEALIQFLFQILDTIKRMMEAIALPDARPVLIDDELKAIRTFMDSLDLSSSPAPSAVSSPQIAAAAQSSGGQPAEKINSWIGKETIRVDTRRLDDLLAAVGELVIAKNRLLESTKILAEAMNIRAHQFIRQSEKDDINEQNSFFVIVNHIARLISGLQETSMRLRMVPIGYTFRKFERVVRDLSKRNYKDVQLIIEGETTEVDRMLIETMEDPLLHIIRNCVDHGIELPEERKKQNKPPTGTIRLTAFQENNLIVIRIQDDGRGMDPKVIGQKAIEKGIIQSIENLSDKNLLDLIFLPGFSTASEVTEVSGRGVGLDVVRKNIMKLNGMIEVQSQPGEGSTFILKLPLTLAIIQVLSVIVGETKKQYAIPLSNVAEILRIQNNDIYTINGHMAIQHRNEVMPVLRLDALLNLPPSSAMDKQYIIVIATGEKRFGLIVDGLASQQDVVIKPLGSYLENLRGIAGATILGNGEISLIIDVGSLWDMELQKVAMYN